MTTNNDRPQRADAAARRPACGGAALVVAAMMAWWALPGPDARKEPPHDTIGDAYARMTVYDCEQRPEGAVVKPDAKPRDSIRMSGCEMIFWAPDALRDRAPAPQR